MSWILGIWPMTTNAIMLSGHMSYISMVCWGSLITKWFQLVSWNESGSFIDQIMVATLDTYMLTQTQERGSLATTLKSFEDVRVLFITLYWIEFNKKYKGLHIITTLSKYIIKKYSLPNGMEKFHLRLQWASATVCMKGLHGLSETLST